MTGGTQADLEQDAGANPSEDDQDEPVHPGTGACSMRHCDARASLYTCIEWGVDDSQHVELCAQLDGEVKAGACPVSDDRASGCKSSSPFTDEGCAIEWFYGPYIEIDDVRTDCAERGGEFLD